MPKVIPTPLPATALLARYSLQEGAYVDCFKASIAQSVPLEAFIAAFFDTWIFRIERKILSVVARTPSSMRDVHMLATGTSDRFASWRVEAREDEQILLAVGDGPIRTWLMRCDCATGSELYFGSAVLPMSHTKDGRPKLGFGFRALLWFHEVYSRVLLRAAVRKLDKSS